MVYAVKCNRHYPGYEVAHAPTLEVLKSQFPSWKTCEVGDAIIELPENGQYDEELSKKLMELTVEFQKTH